MKKNNEYRGVFLVFRMFFRIVRIPVSPFIPIACVYSIVPRYNFFFCTYLFRPLLGVTLNGYILGRCIFRGGCYYGVVRVISGAGLLHSYVYIVLFVFVVLCGSL